MHGILKFLSFKHKGVLVPLESLCSPHRCRSLECRATRQLASRPPLTYAGLPTSDHDQNCIKDVAEPEWLLTRPCNIPSCTAAHKSLYVTPSAKQSPQADKQNEQKGAPSEVHSLASASGCTILNDPSSKRTS